MKNTTDSNFGFILNPRQVYGPRKVFLTSADLYENVQVHIPTKEELDELHKIMAELISKYCKHYE